MPSKDAFNTINLTEGSHFPSLKDTIHNLYNVNDKTKSEVNLNSEEEADAGVLQKFGDFKTIKKKEQQGVETVRKPTAIPHFLQGDLRRSSTQVRIISVLFRLSLENLLSTSNY